MDEATIKLISKHVSQKGINGKFYPGFRKIARSAPVFYLGESDENDDWFNEQFAVSKIREATSLLQNKLINTQLFEHYWLRGVYKAQRVKISLCIDWFHGYAGNELYTLFRYYRDGHKDCKDSYVHLSDRHKEADWTNTTGFYKDGLKIKKVEQEHRGALDTADYLLASFVLDLSTCHRCSVSGKSDTNKNITWEPPFAYYTLLAQGTFKSTATGKTFDFKSEKRIRAHKRRGHIRKLKAAIYGDNVGKLILVKPAWVGPKEWECDESGRTYKLLGDRVNGEFRKDIKKQIYLIQSGTYFKIGISSCPEARVKQLQTPQRSMLLAYGPSNNPELEENKWHMSLRNYHSHGEWFLLDEKTVSIVAQSIKQGIKAPKQL